MATQLGLYNGALRHLGERRLASVSEAREPRLEIDDVYTATLKECLEDGLWDFSMRAVQMSASDAVEPNFGYEYAFAKPTDWVRVYLVSADATLSVPLRDKEFTEEAGYFYANYDPIYAKYVSNDATYGLDLTRWPESYTAFVEVRLARKVAPRLKSSEQTIARIEKEHSRLRSNALAKDAYNLPVQTPPMGSWASSRVNGYLRRDR